jgi:hypothetical protein
MTGIVVIAKLVSEYPENVTIVLCSDKFFVSSLSCPDRCANSNPCPEELSRTTISEPHHHCLRYTLFPNMMLTQHTPASDNLLQEYGFVTVTCHAGEAGQHCNRYGGSELEERLSTNEYSVPLHGELL